MLSPSTCFLLLVALGVGGSASLGALEGTYTITTVPGNGLNVGLNTYRPGGYDDPANATKVYPLWVFLGGAGETGDPTNASVVLDKTTRHGPSKEIRINNRDYPCIVVTPCTKNLQAARPDWLNDMVEMLKATERVDPNRVYFSGLCTGAGGVMEYAQLYPYQLAGIFPIITQSGFWNPGRLAKVPTWMFHAYDDPSVERFETIAWANAIANAQSPAPLDCMANYPYSYTDGGSPRRNALDQTGSFRPATGWDWVPGVTPTFDAMLRFTLYSSDKHNSWQRTINNATVLHWAFRQHRKTAFAITPSPLPGTIQAEDFDRGGPSLAYKDHTASNSGGSTYRHVANTFDGTMDDESVDLMDIDGEVAVTHTQAGEWLEYTVNASSGTYDLTLRVAAAAAGSSLRFTSNGVPLTANIPVPATTGFTTLTVEHVTLAAGVQTLRLEVEAGGCSIDWFAIDFPVGPADLIVDNLHTDRVTTSGPWALTNFSPGFYATNYLSANPGTVATATFRPFLPHAAWYEVMVYYPSNGSRGIAAVSIQHGDGSAVHVASVDQRVGGGEWQTIGAFPFQVGTLGSVTISSEGATGYVSADAVRFRELPAQPMIDLIVDNRDGARVTTSGPWALTSFTAGFYGLDYLSAAPGSDAVAVFRPNLTQSGFFKVYVQYPANGARGISPITIGHGDGSTIYQTSVDQRVNGGAWTYLGAFHFASGTGPAVTIHSLGAGGYVSADAVRFEQAEALPEIDLIVDNRDGARVTTTGPWALTNFTAGFYGLDYLSAAPGSDATAVFRPNLSRAGYFKVFMQYPANPARGVSPVTVAHEDGSVIYQTAVNQRLQGGGWTHIGDFHFEAGMGPAVTITSLGAGGYVSADAVRFEEIDALPPIDQIVDNVDSARVTMIGSWWATTSTPGYYGPDYVSTSPAVDKRVIFRPNLSRDATVDISIWHPASPSRGTTPVTIAYGDGTMITVIDVDQRLEGNQWRFLGTFPLEAGGQPAVTVGSYADGGWISADAIRFQETVISAAQ